MADAAVRINPDTTRIALYEEERLAELSGLSLEREQDMGWYLRKSFPFGPLRINLSKSGIGASVGVKGLRVSTGPKGRQLNAGREGLYYRTSLNSPRNSPLPDPKATNSVVETVKKDQAGDEGSATHAVATGADRQFGIQLMRRILGGLFKGR